MCLSTVYRENGAQQTKLGEYISGVRAEGSKITLTDIMGAETVVFGRLRSVDLVKNQIIIEATEDGQ